MPYKSEKQRRFMHARHPDIAARWDAEAKKKPAGRDNPRRAKGKAKKR